MISVDLIFTRKDARPVDEAAVSRLVDSINEVGLINPIRVRPARRFVDGIEADAYELIAGAHRLAAVKRLGFESVEAIVVTADDLHAELAMIDENLMRSNYTPAQQAAAVARRKAIYLELYPETAAGAAGGHGKHGSTSDKMSFAETTAQSTGKDRRTIERAAARGKALGDDLDGLEGTSLDKGHELDALAKLPLDERRSLIERAKAGERVSARKEPKVAADPLDDTMASERQVARLMDAWNAAGPDARQEFLLRIDVPVFDRGAAA